MKCIKCGVFAQVLELSGITSKSGKFWAVTGKESIENFEYIWCSGDSKN